MAENDLAERFIFVFCSEARELLISRTVHKLSEIAYSYHRVKNLADTIVSDVLPELCCSILDYPNKVAAKRVDTVLDTIDAATVLDTIDAANRKFWGSGDLFSRRRAARDCILLTYHDEAERLLRVGLSQMEG